MFSFLTTNCNFPLTHTLLPQQTRVDTYTGGDDVGRVGPPRTVGRRQGGGQVDSENKTSEKITIIEVQVQEITQYNVYQYANIFKISKPMS